MRTRGRPKTSNISRAEQLRRAQRAKRRRDRDNGVVYVQLALPKTTAAKLSALTSSGNFAEEFVALLDEVVVRIADYPVLKQLAWNRAEQFIPAREAFGLYERNWRFMDQKLLGVDERLLLQKLKDRFGAGLIHGRI